MPGKVNPVIAESLLMVCAQVVGHDAAIAWCAAAGNFELNVMMPVMAYDLLDSIALLAAATRNFADKLVDGLEADRDRAEGFVEQSLAMATALAPEIGYEKAAALAKEAYRDRPHHPGGGARAERHSRGAPERTARPPRARREADFRAAPLPPQTRMKCHAPTRPSRPSRRAQDFPAHPEHQHAERRTSRISAAPPSSCATNCAARASTPN